MKKIMLVCLIMLMGTPAGAVDLRLSGAEASPHSAEPGECLYDAHTLAIGVEWEALGWGWGRIDLGAEVRAHRFTSGKRERVGAPLFDEQDRYGAGLYPLVKPTLRIWRLEPYVALGAGPDYQSTADGLSLGLLVRLGVDLEVVDGIFLGVYQAETNRLDGGKYQENLGVSLKFSF